MQARLQDLGQGIYCIDTEMHRQGLASCYLIRDQHSAAFVDTGTHLSVPYLLSALEQLSIPTSQVRYIIPTHIHLDHAGGSGELMQHCVNAELVVHPKGAAHMIDPAKLLAGATAVYGEEEFQKTYGTLKSCPAERVISADDGLQINLDQRTLTFIHTPGHANHHGCIHDSLSGAMFTGDTFGLSYREFDTDKGALVYATSSPVAFDPESWQQSLDKMLAMQPSAMLLTHYCRVTEVERLAASLRDSVRAMESIALAEEAADPAGRKERMEQAITELFYQQAQSHGCDMDLSRFKAIMGMDIDLNAQGLEVWLQRRARNR